MNAHARLPRVDSTTETTRIIQAAAAADLSPPSTLTAGGKKHWESIIATLPRSSWDEHKLNIAVQLANDMAAMFDDSEVLRKEPVVKTRFGPKVNPINAVVQARGQRILSYRRSLGIDARAGVRPRDAVDLSKRASIAKQAEEQALGDDDDDDADDGLIAQPT